MQHRRVQRRWKTLGASLVGLGLIGATTAVIAGSPSSHAAQAQVRSPERTQVRVAPVEDLEHRRSLSFAGALEARRTAVLAVMQSGRVSRLSIDLGDRVAQGELLLTLERGSLRHSVDAALAARQQVEAQLVEGQRVSRRMDRLARSQAVARAQVQSAASQVDLLRAGRRYADAELARARWAYGEGALRAPFAGKVAAVSTEVGEFARAGQALVELVYDSGLELEVELPESSPRSIAEGDPVRVRLPLLDRDVPGTIVALGAAAPRRAALFPVRVELAPDPQLRAGMTAELVLEETPTKGLSVIVEAVVDRSGDAPRVYALRDGRVEAVDVELVALVGAHAVVQGELKAGEEVVVGGHARISDGEEVQVRR